MKHLFSCLTLPPQKMGKEGTGENVNRNAQSLSGGAWVIAGVSSDRG